MIIHWNWGYPTFKSTCRKVLLLALPLVVTLDRYLGMLKNMLPIHDKKHSRFFVFYPTCQHCYLFKTIQFGRTLDFFEPIPVSASHYDSKIQEVFVPDLPFETLQKAVGTANKWGSTIQWSCPNIGSQPTVDGGWIRYLKKGQPGGYGIKRYFVSWVCPGI